jgi:hypothetical protein
MSSLRDIIHAVKSASPWVPRLTQAQEDVAGHLRGNEALVTHLTKLLSTRIEDRGALPPPSNPHDAAILLGRDAECRELSRLLCLLASLPVAPLADEEDIARPPDPRALGLPRIRPS